MQSRSTPLPANVWQYKPWWCQPWSILLTSIGLIGGSWFFFHLLWVTVLVSIPVLTWMIFFLLVYPKLMADSGLLQQMEGESQSMSDEIR
jgi:hypothetical protein